MLIREYVGKLGMGPSREAQKYRSGDAYIQSGTVIDEAV